MSRQQNAVNDRSMRPDGSGVRLRASVITALLLIVGSGAAYRVVADRLASVRGGVPLARGTLGELLPLQIGDWRGRDVPLDEEIVKKTDTDDHVKRIYVHQRSRQAAVLFIAYGIRLRDLMPHRPEVCYTLQGWTLEDTQFRELTDASGAALPCQLRNFSRGALQQSETAVLYYYVIDGEPYGDVSALRSQAWTLGHDIRYAAQIQVSSSMASPSGDGSQAVVEFAIAAAPVIQKVIEDAVGTATNQQVAQEGQGN